MLKTPLTALLFWCSLIFSTANYASHVSLLPAHLFPGQDEWNFALSIDLGPNSKNTITEPNGTQASQSSITGTLNIFFNPSYTGTPATVKVDFSSTNVMLNPLVLILDNNPASTNQFSHHFLNETYGNEICLSNPTRPACANYNSPNASIGYDYDNPFNYYFTVESAIDIELYLGPLSFINTGSGNTQVDINVNALYEPIGEVQLYISEAFGNGDQTYTFDSNPTLVPLPASIWLLLSGSVALFGFRKRTNT